MANTPHNQDPNRAPGSPGGQPPKAKKPESSPDDFHEIDPNLLGSGEFSELDPKLLESADALPIDPRLLESGEHDPGDFRERLQQQPDAKRPPDSAEVQYTTPPPVGDPGSFDGGVSYGAMPQPTDIPTAGLSKIPSSGDSGSGIDWAPPSHADSGQGSSFAIPTAQPVSGSGSNLGISSEHLSIPSEDTGSAEFPIPSGTPISSDLRMSDANRPSSAQDSSGTLEPIAPAAGWLDSMEQPMETPPAETSPAAAEAIESSDIFGGGPVPRATAADQSDVIGATAFKKGGPLESNESGRTSDVALSFNRQQGGSSNLPVADEVLEAEAIAEHPSSLFSNPPPAGLPFDSAKLADAPPLPEAAEPVEVPEFGKSPEQGNDASSILADLAEADEHGTKDSSAVKLESPGVERTFSSDQGEGTEFDLTINDALPHELIAEAASDHGPEEWESLPGPEMFANDKTAHDVDLEKSPRPVRIEHDWAADVPPGPASQSSIFSDRTPARDQPLPGDGSEVQLANTPTPGPSDSSVEFSDQPEAELESSESAVFDRSNPANQPPGERPKSKHSVSEFELPAAQGAADAAAMDWSQTHEVDVPPRGRVPRAEDSSILSRETITQQELEKEGTLPETRHAAPLPKDAKGSPAPPKPGRQIRKAKPSSHGERKLSDPSVEIDWMASSGSAEAAPMGAGDSTVGAVDTAGGGAAHTRTAAGRPEKRAMAGTGSTRGAWIGGVIVGMVVAGGGFAGAYFGGFIPNSKGTGQKAITNPGQQGANTNTAASGTPGAADAAAALRAGDAAKARQIALALNDSTPAGKALAGEASLFALVQEKGTAIAADNPDLAAARENLQAVVNDPSATTAEGKLAAVKAAVQLGISHEIAGDRAAAKKVYEEAKAKFPDFADTFDAALDRLAVTRTSESTSLRLPTLDARQLLFAITLLQSDSRAGEAEAGVYFWRAVNKATGERYAEAIEEIKKARAAHLKQAKAKAGIGLNPLSDPLEQMFPRCCDDLKAYWELRGAIYSNKAVADIYKREGAQKAFATLDAAQVRAAKALADLKSANDKLTLANANFRNSEDALKTAKAKVTSLEKDLKTAADARLTVEKKLDSEEKIRKTAEAARLDAEKARRTSEAFIASLAKELQSARLLPEKYDAAEFLAAQKRTAERATGPNLGTLVPSAMMAVGGSGLTSAQLIDIAERLSRAETTAKTAADRLATETKKLQTSHAAELKKLTDGYEADLKKLTDAQATDISKLKDDQKAALKKAADQYAIDAKKLKEGFDGKVRNLEAAVASEKKRVEAITAQFKIDLGNAIGPADALDLWLPLLAELRRPADADPALATANKVIASAAADSEDAAKARTVAGLALIIKNDLPQSKAHLQAAKASPAHRAGLDANKAWAQAAEVALASLSDPLAPYRRPANVPTHDAVAAARDLDAGIAAYRDGRYEAAVAALSSSAKADPANPIPWYYLGASRWATGATDAAKGDFEQGATREAASDLTRRTISAAISAIQGAARDALNAARP